MTATLRGLRRALLPLIVLTGCVVSRSPRAHAPVATSLAVPEDAVTAQTLAPTPSVRVAEQRSGVAIRLRGISAVDDRVAWASGQRGTVLRTIDGGANWQSIVVPGAGALDFRDVEAFGADTAVLLAIGPGELSRVYRTTDGGVTWTLTLQNHDPRAFYDCMAFDDQRGWLLGDPVDGRFQLLTSSDGGLSWHPTLGPPAADGEAAFAASGTCIARGHGSTVVATGGAAPALRVLRDGMHQAWQQLPLPGVAPRTDGVATAELGASQGMFSVAAMQADDAFLAVGGDYRDEPRPANAVVTLRTILPERIHHGRMVMPAMYEHDIKDIAQTTGYRSSVACEGPVCVAVGPTGIDVLRDGDWMTASTIGFDAVSLAGKRGWAVGNGGRLARIELRH